MVSRGQFAFTIAIFVVGCSREAALENDEPDAFVSTPKASTDVIATTVAAAEKPAPQAPDPTPSDKPHLPEAQTDKSGFRYCDVEHPETPSPDNRIYATWQSFRVPLGSGLGTGAPFEFSKIPALLARAHTSGRTPYCLPALCSTRD